MKKIFLAVVFIIVIIGCDDEILKINENSEIVIHVLSVEKFEEKTSNLILNRKIIKSKLLNNKEKAELIKIISSKNNFEKFSKKCKFEPVYAIEVDKEIKAVFDAEFCPKLMIFDKEKKDTIIDLKSNNSYLPFLKKIEFLSTFK